VINLVTKLRIVKLKRRKKRREKKFGASSYKQEVLLAALPRRSTPGVTHRFPRSVIPLEEDRLVTSPPLLRTASSVEPAAKEAVNLHQGVLAISPAIGRVQEAVRGHLGGRHGTA